MQRKIRKAQTDSIPGLTFDPTARPGVSNLFSMYSALSDRSLDELVCDYQVRRPNLVQYNRFTRPRSLMIPYFCTQIHVGEKCNHICVEARFD